MENMIFVVLVEKCDFIVLTENIILYYFVVL